MLARRSGPRRSRDSPRGGSWTREVAILDLAARQSGDLTVLEAEIRSGAVMTKGSTGTRRSPPRSPEARLAKKAKGRRPASSTGSRMTSSPRDYSSPPDADRDQANASGPSGACGPRANGGRGDHEPRSPQFFTNRARCPRLCRARPRCLRKPVRGSTCRRGTHRAIRYGHPWSCRFWHALGRGPEQRAGRLRQ